MNVARHLQNLSSMVWSSHRKLSPANGYFHESILMPRERIRETFRTDLAELVAYRHEKPTGITEPVWYG